MELADVRKLVDWKMYVPLLHHIIVLESSHETCSILIPPPFPSPYLDTQLTKISRHGQFRPTLPKLVASNPAALIPTTLSTAFTLYSQDPTNLKPALTKIAELRGIGPATASLILAIYDPENVVFFSDEAYRWLVHGGEKVKIGYTMKEFGELDSRAKELGKRLGVGMVEVEKVAYVVFKEGGLDEAASGKGKSAQSKKEKEVPKGKKTGRTKVKDIEETPKNEPTARGRGRPKEVKRTSQQKDSKAEIANGGKKRKADGAVAEKPKSTRAKRIKS